jgi:hypothetical protein
MTKHIGLDVHGKDTVACVYDRSADSFSYETVKTSAFSLKRLFNEISRKV